MVAKAEFLIPPRITATNVDNSFYYAIDYHCLPTIRDEWFDQLMAAYEKIVREHMFLAEILKFELSLQYTK